MREVSIFDILGRDEISLDKNSIKFYQVKGSWLLEAVEVSDLSSLSSNVNPSILLILDISELNLFEIDREVNNGNSGII